MQFEYNGLVAEFLMSSLYVTICRYASVSLPCNRPFYYSSLRPTYVLSRPIVRPTVRSSIDHPSVHRLTDSSSYKLTGVDSCPLSHDLSWVPCPLSHDLSCPLSHDLSMSFPLSHCPPVP